MLYCSIWNSKKQNSPVTSDVFSEGIAIGAGHNALVEFGVVKNQYLNILE
jgi:phenylalanyl-tRNA synthetase beta chain